MVIDIAFANILMYVLLFIRFLGMVALNPLLSRNNVPMMVRTGLAFLLAFLLAPMQSEEALAQVYAMDTATFGFAVVWEAGIGMVLGYIFQLFYMMLFFSGDLVDTEIGMAMAKTFDPGSSVNSGFSASFFTLMFTLYIFAAGAHLEMFYLFADTLRALPVGAFRFSGGILTFILQLFVRVFTLALRLWAPFMAAEFVLQMGMGILMKFIPQISVFVINFQMKILLGLLLLYWFAPIVGNFVTNYIGTMLDSTLDAVAQMEAAVAAATA